MENNGKKNFEPLIVAFLCNWCSYAGADLAGVSRYQYPSGVRIIRTMCSGRINPFMVFRAFHQGADGVIVAGCHLGDCHYISGNVHAQEKMAQVSRVIEKSKIPTQRFRLVWVSASEGKIFAQIMTKAAEELKILGPLSEEVINGVPTINKVVAAESLFLKFPVRWLTAKAGILMEEENVFGEREDPNKLKKMADIFFPNENPVGKTINIDNQLELTVDGVLQELPSGSHLEFDFLMQFSRLPEVMGYGGEDEWGDLPSAH